MREDSENERARREAQPLKVVSSIDLAKAWTPPPRVKGPCIAQDGAQDVRCRGQELDAILWQGRTWAVTDHGIERRDGFYTIAKDRLGEMLPGDSWIGHIGRKGCADVEDFTSAYLVACARFGVPLTPEDVATLDRDLERGRGYEKKERERREREGAR